MGDKASAAPISSYDRYIFPVRKLHGDNLLRMPMSRTDGAQLLDRLNIGGIMG
jgi:hypothetical protein